MTYVCPATHAPLVENTDGLRTTSGNFYPLLDGDIADFIAGTSAASLSDEVHAMYHSAHAGEIYRNFLDWLFASFNVNEDQFREDLTSPLRLKSGDTVLVTGCGLGEDLFPIARAIGPSGRLYAQDLSKTMVLHASRNFARQCDTLRPKFFIGDARSLPFATGTFDAVFHFGGINLFGDMKQSIAEMARVTRPGGRVAFGDESVAPWLRSSEYAKVAIANNPLWASPLPLADLPYESDDVHCSWVLGNCFYLIDFRVSSHGPVMNIDIPHKGRRGGTARSRYYGQLEGISPELHGKVLVAAMRDGVSIHEWLERKLTEAISKA